MLSLTCPPFSLNTQSTFTTLPNGLFDKMPARATLDRIQITSEKPIDLSKNAAKVFGQPLPKLKMLTLNFPTALESKGLGSQLFNANLANLQV